MSGDGFPINVADGEGEAEVAGVEVIVEDDDCGAKGYGIADVNEDCVVNLADFAVFFGQWLFCTDPYDDPEYLVWGACDASWNLAEAEEEEEE